MRSLGLDAATETGGASPRPKKSDSDSTCAPSKTRVLPHGRLSGAGATQEWTLSRFSWAVVVAFRSPLATPYVNCAGHAEHHPPRRGRPRNRRPCEPGKEARMSDEQMVAGMRWVSSRLTELGQRHGTAVSSLGWDADAVAVGGNRHSYAPLMNGQRRAMTFDDADREDLPEDPRLQIQVEWELRALLEDHLTGKTLVVLKSLERGPAMLRRGRLPSAASSRYHRPQEGQPWWRAWRGLPRRTWNGSSTMRRGASRSYDDFQ